MEAGCKEERQVRWQEIDRDWGGGGGGVCSPGLAH